MKSLREFLTESFPKDICDVIAKAGQLADRQGQGVVLVGGVVRDYLLGRSVHEADIMFDPPVKVLAEELTHAVDGKLVFHEPFLTFTIHLPSGAKVDLVTARSESYYKRAALPAVKPADIQKDLGRRDFTINAMACSLSQKDFGKLLDPFGGQAALEKKIIRALHSESFNDDPTRIFRAARFAGRLGFSVEKPTLEWISQAIDEKVPEFLSPVRRRHEFELVLKEQDPLPALELLKDWKVLEMVHSEWKGILFPKFSSRNILEDRLVDWFKPLGKDAATRQMTDLSFERAVKKSVIDRL